MNGEPMAKEISLQYRLNHIPFLCLRRLIQMGVLPQRLLDVPTPVCPACQYGKLHRRPWHSKGQPSRTRRITHPGQVVSVDQLTASADGFMAQLKGKLTKKHNKHATVFVNQFSRLSYVHLHSTLSSADTLFAKHQFEIFARECGVKIEHYHGDNGCFADNAWINDCRTQYQ